MAGVNDFEVGKRYLVNAPSMCSFRCSEIEILEKSQSKKYVKVLFDGSDIGRWYNCSDTEYLEELLPEKKYLIPETVRRLNEEK